MPRARRAHGRPRGRVISFPGETTPADDERHTRRHVGRAARAALRVVVEGAARPIPLELRVSRRRPHRLLARNEPRPARRRPRSSSGTCCATSASTRSAKRCRRIRSGTGSRSRSTTGCRRGCSTGRTRRTSPCTSRPSASRRSTCDAVIWCVDYSLTNQWLPDRLKQVLADEGSDVFTAEMLAHAAPTLAEFDALAADPFVAFLEPPSLDERIINQFALFSLLSGPAPASTPGSKRTRRPGARSSSPRS